MKRRKLIRSYTPEITDSAQLLIEEHKIDEARVRKIRGSGKKGKITQRDIKKFLRESDK